MWRTTLVVCWWHQVESRDVRGPWGYGSHGCGRWRERLRNAWKGWKLMDFNVLKLLWRGSDDLASGG